MNALTNGILIKVEDNENTFHTLDDWGLALENNNYIGDPEPETRFISVPGRDGLIDVSSALSGRTVYKKRELSFVLGGKHPTRSWDSIISNLRNEINGRMCRLIIDNDPDFYWRGRVYISGFDRIRELGKFTLSVPDCEPYKYCLTSSIEPWEWDRFNFENGIIYFIPELEVDETATITIPAGYKEVKPDIIVSEMVSDTFTVTFNEITYSLDEGSNKIPAIIVNGETEAVLTFSGSATVVVSYRGGSL